MTGMVAYGDPRRPAITWLGGQHAATLLERNGFEMNGQDYWPRVWAARGLLYLGRPDAEGAVISGMSDPAWRVREMCAKVARRHTIAGAEDDLTRLLDDPVARVRMAAEAALSALAR